MVQFYQDSADKGNVDAQTAVGQVYNYGMHGMRRDHATAMHYLQKAADAGEAQATAHLGHMHANGLVRAWD
jgi:SEL1 protein